MPAEQFNNDVENPMLALMGQKAPKGHARQGVTGGVKL